MPFAIQFLIIAILVALGALIIWQYIDQIQLEFFLYSALAVSILTLLIACGALTGALTWILATFSSLLTGGLIYAVWYVNYYDL